MGTYGGGGPRWALTDGMGRYLRTVQMVPRCREVEYFATRADYGEERALFCKKSAARMLAALLNQHVAQEDRKWRVVQA